MTSDKNPIYLFFILVTLFSYKVIFKTAEAKSDSTSSISLMTYNLENLFDTIDDPLTDDEAYLPKKIKSKNKSIIKKCEGIKNTNWRKECLHQDWTEKVLNSKLNRISDVILKSHSWVGPDILILQEVENLGVIEKLRKKHLIKHYPYPAILIEGRDPRGIDVAILSKFKLNKRPILHNVTSRGILEVELKTLDNHLISVFAVHFPSQRAPYRKRKEALEQLERLLNSAPSKNLVIAAGDMNITEHEFKKHKPFKSFKSKFIVSHVDGCKSCKGTHYYGPKRSWSFLDVILVSKDHPIWKLNLNSISIFNQSLYQTNKQGLPERFNLGRKQIGISDHWPLKLEIFKN